MAFGNMDGGSNQPMSEINVTPLVDVMLVLLVIFIVAAPLMAQALLVDLPRAKAEAMKEPDVIVLEVQADGSLMLEATLIADEDLSGRLRGLYHENSERVLKLGGDGVVPYQRIAEVLSLVKQSGFQRIAFATQAPR